MSYQPGGFFMTCRYPVRHSMAFHGGSKPSLHSRWSRPILPCQKTIRILTVIL